MDWKLELDALIEGTIALAKDVKVQSNSDKTVDVRAAEQALAHTSRANPLRAAVTPMTRPNSERDEILQRVSHFRAHQEKMARERQDHYLQTRAKMLASLNQHRPGRRSGEMPDGPKQKPRRS